MNSGARRDTSFFRQRSWVGHGCREHIREEENSKKRKTKKWYHFVLFCLIYFVLANTFLWSNLCSSVHFCTLEETTTRCKTKARNRESSALDTTKLNKVLLMNRWQWIIDTEKHRSLGSKTKISWGDGDHDGLFSESLSNHGLLLWANLQHNSDISLSNLSLTSLSLSKIIN